MTQLYKITRRGAIHRRWEHSDGTPWKGETKKLNTGTNQFEPVLDSNGHEAILRTYGTKKQEAFSKEKISEYIRLTPDGARALAHLKLVMAVTGVDPESYRPERKSAPAPTDEDQTDEDEASDEQDEDLVIDVPKNWHKLKSHEISKLACQISGEKFRLMKKAEASAIIERYVNG